MSIEPVITESVYEKARTLKYQYLQSRGKDGGYSYDFIDSYIPTWLKSAEGEKFLTDTLQKQIPSLFQTVCRSAWSNKLSSAPIGQITLEFNGIPAPNELRYADKKVKGGYVTVLTRYATVEQFFKAWQEVQKNANTQIIAAAKMYQQYEWLMDQANGNQATLIADLLTPVKQPEPA